MNKKEKQDYMELAKELAYQAGEIMLKYFDNNPKEWQKNGGEIVTIADEEINKIVIQNVIKHFPSHSILGEEESLDNKSNYIWVCDPIDGTIPFSKGIPVSVFSLALVVDGKPILGVVNDPFTNRLYSAIKGFGAFENTKKINVNKNPLTDDSIVDCEWWPQADFDIISPLKLFSYKTGVFMPLLGSTINACMQVARGKYDGCIFAGGKGRCVDIATAKIIVEEAGGSVTDLFGVDQRYDSDIRGAIVSNEIIHTELVDALSFTQETH